MNITKIVFMSHTYITTDYLNFGSYDNSSEIERANALYVLRLATNLWNGSVVYDPDADSLDVDIEEQHPLKCMITASDPTNSDFKHLVEWSHPQSQPPVVIHQIRYYGNRIYVREGIAKEHDLITLLEEYQLLDDETQSEVTALLQDQNWIDQIWDKLQTLIIEHVQQPSNNEQFKGLINCELKDLDDEPSLNFSEEHAKAAFWEALKERGHYGCFENTNWVDLRLDELLPTIVKKLLDNKEPPKPQN